jgi:hypothetical protein
VNVNEYENGKMKEIRNRISTPKKQFEGPSRLFLQERIRRGQEWTAKAVEALRERRVLVSRS